VTVDKTTQEWYLLETRPGMQFRQIASDFGTKAAHAYFRRIANQNLRQRILLLNDIFQDTYEPQSLELLERYACVVDAIASDEITSYETIPMGGRNGDVYRGEWQCPREVGVAAPRKLHVALKRIWPPRLDHPDSRSVQRLFREVSFGAA
jgi:hypothetical protein